MTKLRVCFLCQDEITAENDTWEHLIPNAVGGRRKVKGFNCRKCNSTTGETWDAELARQLLPLSLLLGISRERGNPPPLKVVTTAGEHITIGADGKLALSDPVFEASPGTGGGTTYRVSARTRREARQIAQGLKRKHPEIDVDAALAQAEVVETYPQGATRHELNFGGEISGRSIVKSCVAMAFASGIDWRTCEHALRYLRDKMAPPCFGHYQEKDLVVGRVPGAPIHCVAVRADPEKGSILAYAEYFGIYRIVACLGDGYAGSLVHETYAVDPRDGANLNVQVDLAFDRPDIEDIYAYKRISNEAYARAVSDVIGPALERRNAAEQRRVLDRAVEQAFDTCGAKPGEMLTEEHMKSIARSVAQNVTPFLLRRMQPVK